MQSICLILLFFWTTILQAQNFVETQIIQSPDSVDYAYFGRSLAVSDGFLAAIGNGNIHIYKRETTGIWAAHKTITGSYGNNNQMDLSGNILAVENSDQIDMYYKNQGGYENWGLVTSISSPDGTSAVSFPSAIDLWDDYLVVSDEYFNSNAGKVYLFKKDQGGSDNWGILKGFTASGSDNLGTDVAIGQGLMAIGHPLKSGTWSFEGEVLIYQMNSGGSDNWGFIKSLVKSGAHGSYDLFGKSVSISQNDIIVGANLGGPGGGFIHGRNEGGSDNWGQITSSSCFALARDVVDLHNTVSVFGRSSAQMGIYTKDTTTGMWSGTSAAASNGSQNGMGERVKVWNHTVISANYDEDLYGFNGVGALHIFEDTAYYNANPPIITETTHDKLQSHPFATAMNPFNSALQIQVHDNSKKTSIHVQNLTGATMYSGTLPNNQTLNTSNWPSGLYLVSLSKGQQSIVIKVVKTGMHE